MMQKNNLWCLLVGLLVFSIIGLVRLQKPEFPQMLSELYAATFVTQNLTVTLQTITSLTVSGSPGTLVISDAPAGSDPTAAMDTSTQYLVSTNAATRVVIGKINSAMPSNLTLSVELAASGLGTSAGEKNLATAEVTLVTAITRTYGIQTVTYRFKSGLVPDAQSGSRTATLQIK